MAIEELIRQRFELPAFSTLLRIARTTRNTVNRRYQSRVCELLDAGARHRLLAILSRPLANRVVYGIRSSANLNPQRCHS